MPAPTTQIKINTTMNRYGVIELPLRLPVERCQGSRTCPDAFETQASSYIEMEYAVRGGDRGFIAISVALRRGGLDNPDGEA